ANKLLGSFIKQIIGEYDARLASFEGGSMRNAIPREATAVITIQEENLDILEDSIYDYEALINEAYNGVEGHLILSFQQVDLPAGLIPEEVQDDFINALEGVHNGVLRAFPDMPETVETSSNLAIINSQEGNITCMFLVRSASEFMKKQLVSMIQSTFSLAGAKVTTAGDYPGWEPKRDSHIIDVMVAAYEKLYGIKPNVNVIHAGLECGIIQDAIGTMDMISFGPTIVSPHTPNEKVEIASIKRFWDYLLAVLKTI
ncbi:MAG: M20/M25/M40 family metallo-hydrolase, partial [Bacteroidota bacterium]|nr:M20/M25/M40 family metallo-hydrolase [Bacteroidota bacterium]